MKSLPTSAWTVAGSDSSGHAGIQADLRAFEAFGVSGCSAITAVTAQNPDHCEAVFPLSPAQVRAQWESLCAYYNPTAVKSGLLGNEEIVRTFSECVATVRSFVTVDPVCVASSGFRFVSDDALAAYKNLLFPRTDLVTPNLDEAFAFSATRDPREAAKHFRALGAGAALVKGGHRDSDFATDYYEDETDFFYLSTPRLPHGNVSGTGCTLSAAITACKALGMQTADAVVVAKAYLTANLHTARQTGSSSGQGARLLHAHWPVAPEDFPRLHRDDTGLSGDRFAACTAPLGFYPIVPRAEWVKRVVEAGARTVQLRVKDLKGEELRREIQQTVALCRDFDVQLFVNDYWELALELGAYGVHLGQEDLATAQISALRKNGLRLGISTHSYSELAAALYHNPSYVALGPIFETTCKSMRFGPQGFQKLKEWAQLCDVPVVAIGGLKAEHAKTAYAAGASGVAVVSDVLAHCLPETRVKEWLQISAEALG